MSESQSAMKTSSLTPETRELLSHFASGNTTPEEAERVRELLRTSKEAKQELDKLEAVWARLDVWDVDVNESIFQPLKLRQAVKIVKQQREPLWARAIKALRFPELLPVSAWAGVAAAACVFAFVVVHTDSVDQSPQRRSADGQVQVAAATPSPAVEEQPIFASAADNPPIGESRHEMAEAALMRKLLESSESSSTRTLTGVGLKVQMDSSLGRQPRMESSFAPNGTSLPGRAQIDLAAYRY